jgi:uncharacterized protein YbjQ (UPF0145 family)
MAASNTQVSIAADALRALIPDADPIAMLDVSEQGRARARRLCASTPDGLVVFNPDSPRESLKAVFSDLESAVLDQQADGTFRIALTSRSRRTLAMQGPLTAMRRIAMILSEVGVTVTGVAELRLMNDAAHAPDAVNAGGLLTPVLVVTTDAVPGHAITHVYGVVTGTTVRARNFLSDAGAEFRSMFGGELGGVSKMVAASRDLAEDRLRDAARTVGANAVIGVRFDTEQVGPSSSAASAVVAYGTAVRVEAVVDSPPSPH